jgi:hypothetical protein
MFLDSKESKENKNLPPNKEVQDVKLLYQN